MKHGSGNHGRSITISILIGIVVVILLTTIIIIFEFKKRNNNSGSALSSLIRINLKMEEAILENSNHIPNQEQVQ